MNRVLAIAAMLEIATGVALLVMPGEVGKLLLGAVSVGMAMVVSRVLGLALIALGIACWPRQKASRMALMGMLAYGGSVALYLGVLGVGGEFAGPALWPAVVLHAALTFVLAIAAARELGMAVVERNGARLP